MKEFIWLVWSNEHGRWWKPIGRGYTAIIGKAGRYSRSQCEAICRNANWNPGLINEVMVLAPEANELIQ